jgi:hypothetical protein
MSTNNDPLNNGAVSSSSSSSSSSRQFKLSPDTAEHGSTEESSDDEEFIGTDDELGDEYEGEGGTTFNTSSSYSHIKTEDYPEWDEKYPAYRERSASGELSEGGLSLGSEGDERSRSGSIGASITPKRRLQNRNSSRRFRERQNVTITSMEERLAEIVFSKNDLQHQVSVLLEEKLKWANEEVAMTTRLVDL